MLLIFNFPNLASIFNCFNLSGGMVICMLNLLLLKGFKLKLYPLLEERDSFTFKLSFECSLLYYCPRNISL